MIDRLYDIAAGRPAPLGPSVEPEGVNFAVFSANATRVELCLFSADGAREVQRLALPEREGDIWYGFVPGLAPGAIYGLRAHGPYRPDEGHRFNPNKLLLDPYARRLTGLPIWDDALMGYDIKAQAADLSFDTRDSARAMPRCVIEELPLPIAAPDRPRRPMAETVIYEAHVKGLTKLWPGLPHAGTYRALAEPPVIEHLTRLGITAVELLPIHAFLTDRFLEDQGLTNYWGYQSIGFFAPDPRYMGEGGLADVRAMVDALHAAGIEVILDVVYNHTGEGNELGPTLSFRGLDNASYYRLAPDPRRYVNDTGTGNTLNVDHPMVLRMVMDSLRYWVQVYGVDGFRFDLASALARTDRMGGGFDDRAGFFAAIRQDPVLAHVKLIAEPWDIGPGGYRVGGFPPPFAEWNDKYRDGIRRFWRGDPGRTPDLATRVSGSAPQFDHSRRAATSSVNFVTAHDGFTLEDVVSYVEKHNEANGEGNRDGHGDNFSDNFGVEGPSDVPEIRAARGARKRAMLATLFLSQGTPMMLAGDEVGHSQGGNNNAYAQDNATAWIDWERADWDLAEFVARLIALRRDHPVLRQTRFLHARPRAADGVADLFWRRPDGKPMARGDWHDPALRALSVELRMAQGSPPYAMSGDAVFAVFNAGGPLEVVVPPAPEGRAWAWTLDSADPGRASGVLAKPRLLVPAQAVVALCLEVIPPESPAT